MNEPLLYPVTKLSDRRIVVKSSVIFTLRTLRTTDLGPVVKGTVDYYNTKSYCRQCGEKLKYRDPVLKFKARFDTESTFYSKKKEPPYLYIHQDDCSASGFVFFMEPYIGGKIKYRSIGGEIKEGMLKEPMLNHNNQLVWNII